MLRRISTRLAWYIRRVSLIRARIGARSYISSGVNLTNCRLAVGTDVFINKGLLVEGDGGVIIGNNVRIGPRVTILTSSHHITDDQQCRASHDLFTKSVVIADGVWIGASVTVLPGVEIGAGSVIAAGAIVTKDVPISVIAAGVPARVIRSL